MTTIAIAAAASRSSSCPLRPLPRPDGCDERGGGDGDGGRRADSADRAKGSCIGVAVKRC